MKPILLWGGCRWAPTSQTGQQVDKRQPACSEAASRLCHRKWSLSHADHSRESPYPNLTRRERVRQADRVCLNERSWQIIVRKTRHYKGRNGNIQCSVCKIRPIHSNKTLCPEINFDVWCITHYEHRHRRVEVKKSHTNTLSPLCLLMLSAAMPPCGAAGYMEGMLVVMKSAICCSANKLVGVLPFFSWSWIIVSSSSQNACRSSTQTETQKIRKL